MRQLVRIVYLVLIFTSQFNNLPYAQDDSCENKYKENIHTIKIDTNCVSVKLFRLINYSTTNFLDGVFNMTNESVMPAALFLPLSMFFYGRVNEKPYEENTGVLLASTELLNLFLTQTLKCTFNEARPYHTLQKIHIDCELKKESYKDPLSFPSGHTSMSFSIATIFALRYPKSPQIYIPMYLWALAVGYGRIYWGMHYPHDVLGGMLVGSLSAITIYTLRSGIIKTKNKLFNEENRPDANESNLKTIGWASAIGFLSVSAFEYFFTSSQKSGFTVSPSLNIINSCFEYNLSINF